MNAPWCDRCDSSGWVCQSHVSRPSTCGSERRDACSCSAGIPCPDCNAIDELSARLLQNEAALRTLERRPALPWQRKNKASTQL